MGDFGQIAQNGHRVGAIGILAGKLAQGTRRIALHDQVEQVQHAATIGKAKHGAHLRHRGFPRPVADGLIEQRSCIARRTFSSTGDQRQRVFGNFSAFGLGDLAQQGEHVFGLDAAQIEPLAAGKHRHRHFADFGCGEDKFHMRGRLFQRFQQRIEGRGRQHMHLVDDEHLVAGRGGAIGHALDNRIADILNAGVGGGVHLDHIDMAAFGNGKAGLALPAG